MAVILSKSALRRARKAGRGNPRSRSSICGSEYSGMAALHPLPQRLQGAKLQLLDRSFRLAEMCRRIADAALVDEAADDHGSLVGRQIVDEPEQPGSLVDAIEIDIRVHGSVGHSVGVDRFACDAFRSIDDDIGGDANQPGAERGTA